MKSKWNLTLSNGLILSLPTISLAHYTILYCSLPTYRLCPGGCDSSFSVGPYAPSFRYLLVYKRQLTTITFHPHRHTHYAYAVWINRKNTKGSSDKYSFRKKKCIYGIRANQINSSLTKFIVIILTFISLNKFIMKIHSITNLLVLILYHEC